MTDTHITILMALCQWWQIHTLLFWCHCVSDDIYMYYYFDGIAIVSVMTDTHITILMVLAFFSDDRYTNYYSDDIGIVSVMTDTHITILMALTLCQWWQIHILLFWWHCVSDDRYMYYYSDGIVSVMRYMYYYSDCIGIVSVMTDTHITILMVLAFFSDRYTYYYSVTDTQNTILMTLALCQWWQIHILLFWWHWHCVSDDRYTYYYSDGIGIVSMITDALITILTDTLCLRFTQVRTEFHWSAEKRDQMELFWP